MGAKRFNSPATSATERSAEVGEDPAPPELMLRGTTAQIRVSAGSRILTPARLDFAAIRRCLLYPRMVVIENMMTINLTSQGEVGQVTSFGMVR